MEIFKWVFIRATSSHPDLIIALGARMERNAGAGTVYTIQSPSPSGASRTQLDSLNFSPMGNKTSVTSRAREKSAQCNAIPFHQSCNFLIKSEQVSWDNSGQLRLRTQKGILYVFTRSQNEAIRVQLTRCLASVRAFTWSEFRNCIWIYQKNGQKSLVLSYKLGLSHKICL